MSTQKTEDGFRYNCDADGCRANYEGEGSFGQTFEEAKTHGWVARHGFVGNISTWRHYCPEHKGMKV